MGRKACGACACGVPSQVTPLTLSWPQLLWCAHRPHAPHLPPPLPRHPARLQALLHSRPGAEEAGAGWEGAQPLKHLVSERGVLRCARSGWQGGCACAAGPGRHPTSSGPLSTPMLSTWAARVFDDPDDIMGSVCLELDLDWKSKQVWGLAVCNCNGPALLSAPAPLLSCVPQARPARPGLPLPPPPPPQDVKLEIQVLPANMDKAWIPNFIEKPLINLLTFTVSRAVGRLIAACTTARAPAQCGPRELHSACRAWFTPTPLPRRAVPPQVGVEEAAMRGRLRLTLRPLLDRVPVVGAVQVGALREQGCQVAQRCTGGLSGA